MKSVPLIIQNGREFTASWPFSQQSLFGDWGGWSIGLPSLHTLGIMVSGITERPTLVDGKVEAHEYLSVTLDFDHDLIDGAPAARFTQQLSDLIESGSGLGDTTPRSSRRGQSERDIKEELVSSFSFTLIATTG